MAVFPRRYPSGRIRLPVQWPSKDSSTDCSKFKQVPASVMEASGGHDWIGCTKNNPVLEDRHLWSVRIGGDTVCLGLDDNRRSVFKHGV